MLVLPLKFVNYRLLISWIVLSAIIAIGIWAQTRKKIRPSSNGENVSSNNLIDAEIERLTDEITDRRNAAESWDTWNIRFLFIAGIAALCLVVTAIGVSRSNRRLLAYSDQLDKVKNRKLQTELKQKDDAIAAITGETAKANERAAEANRIAEQERLARIKIEERLAPRHLSNEQIAQLSRDLPALRGKSVNVVFITGDPETGRYASTLESALKAAGLNVQLIPAMILGQVRNGLTLEIGTNRMQDANVLANALINAGLAEKPVPSATSPQSELLQLTIGPK